MQNLVVCVGETCHQSGAEHVLKCFMGLIAKNNLKNEISLKGSFCISNFCEKDKVSVRLGDQLLHITPEEADTTFSTTIWPVPSLCSED